MILYNIHILHMHVHLHKYILIYIYSYTYIYIQSCCASLTLPIFVGLFQRLWSSLRHKVKYVLSRFMMWSSQFRTQTSTKSWNSLVDNTPSCYSMSQTCACVMCSNVFCSFMYIYIIHDACNVYSVFNVYTSRRISI